MKYWSSLEQTRNRPDFGWSSAFSAAEPDICAALRKPGRLDPPNNLSHVSILTHCVCPYTCSRQNSLLSNSLSIICTLGGRLPLYPQYQGRTCMQLAITFMAVVAGLVFSVAVALLVEELIFGQVFRLFFTPQAVRLKAGQEQ